MLFTENHENLQYLTTQISTFLTLFAFIFVGYSNYFIVCKII